MRQVYQKTITACFIGYIVQAIINNFVPLLFVMFQDGYGIPLSRIAVLVSVNYVVQLLVDILAVRFVDRIGYRPAVLAAHVLSALGLLSLAVLTEWMDPFAGIVISVSIYAAGGGLIEVLVSPIMEGCPTAHKSAAMSLLHSFYCWGHVGVVLLSTLFFQVAGIEKWKLLTAVWAAIPAFNCFLFMNVPITPLLIEDKGMSIQELFSSRLFQGLMIMMLCAGAAEQALVQWSSVFAEQTLGIPKSIGDLAGPMAFAIFMGIARVFYSKYGRGIDLERVMKASCILCFGSYLLAGFAELPVFGLMGCAVCGLSVGILWPGTYSRATAMLKRGGTAMFAILAVLGDLGCAAGPAVVGMVTDLCDGNLKIGILVAAVFPVFMLGFFSKKKESRIMKDN